jgi:hypothetical protein
MAVVAGPIYRPILYSGPMVRALLSGAKTQTRRVMSPQPQESFSESYGAGGKSSRRSYGFSWQPRPGDPWIGLDSPELAAACPYGVPGDRLWVRESCCLDWSDRPIYRADDPTGRAARAAGYDREPRWRPSIHMPRWASRITLEITAVRVERVATISDADILAEGIGDYAAGLGLEASTPPRRYRLWEHLWDGVNAGRDGGRYAFGLNPWTWVITFRIV